MLESTVEKYLRAEVVKLGGQCLKLTLLTEKGFPDRTILLPGGRVLFVEVKKPKGGVVSPHQRSLHSRLDKIGFPVTTLYTKDQVDAWVHQQRN